MCCYMCGFIYTHAYVYSLCTAACRCLLVSIFLFKINHKNGKYDFQGLAYGLHCSVTFDLYDLNVPTYQHICIMSCLKVGIHTQGFGKHETSGTTGMVL